MKKVILFVGGHLNRRLVEDKGELSLKTIKPSEVDYTADPLKLPPIGRNIEVYVRRKIHMTDGGPDIEFFAVSRMSDREALEYVFLGHIFGT